MKKATRNHSTRFLRSQLSENKENVSMNGHDRQAPELTSSSNLTVSNGSPPSLLNVEITVRTLFKMCDIDHRRYTLCIYRQRRQSEDPLRRETDSHHGVFFHVSIIYTSISSFLACPLHGILSIRRQSRSSVVSGSLSTD